MIRLSLLKSWSLVTSWEIVLSVVRIRGSTSSAGSIIAWGSEVWFPKRPSPIDSTAFTAPAASAEAYYGIICSIGG